MKVESKHLDREAMGDDRQEPSPTLRTSEAWSPEGLGSSGTLAVAVTLVAVVTLKPLLQAAPGPDLYCILFCFTGHPIQSIWGFVTSTLGHQGWTHLGLNLAVLGLL